LTPSQLVGGFIQKPTFTLHMLATGVDARHWL
jgi:hypothetical protein